MRHRITSFRCVEADVKMSFLRVQRKTCNEVNIRQSSLLRAERIRRGNPRSTRATVRPRRHDERCKARSAEANPAAAECDRVEQRIVRRQRRADLRRRRIVARWQAARFCELVQTHSERRAAPAPASTSQLAASTRVQRIVSCGWPLELMNVASLPSAVGDIGPVAGDRRRNTRDSIAADVPATFGRGCGGQRKRCSNRESA